MSSGRGLAPSLCHADGRSADDLDGYGLRVTRLQDEDGRWIVHSETPIYENEWVTVGLADISQPSGERLEHHTVTLPPGGHDGPPR